MSTEHKFKAKTFKRFTYCDYCEDFIVGIYNQGQRCNNCNYVAHHRCVPMVESEGACVPGKEAIKVKMSKTIKVINYNGHEFTDTYFKAPIFCDICHEFVFGVVSSQGYSCKSCRLRCHRPCHANAEPCSYASGSKPVDNGSQQGLGVTTSAQSTNADDVLIKYSLGNEILGRGQFGVVMSCTNRETKQKYAIKIINLRSFRLRPNLIKIFEREVEVMLLCSHPGIVNLVDSYESVSKMELILDLCDGGDLDDFYDLEVNNARILIWQILVAVQYLHKNEIVHRDLKPANVLVNINTETTDPYLKYQCKVADFGFAKTLEDGDKTHTVAGTRAYLAPEVLFNPDGQGYGHNVDIWSCGAILYRMFCGEVPYDESQIGELHLLRPTYEGEKWDAIPDGPKDLIDKMIVFDPQQRYTSDTCLEHPWFLEDPKLQEVHPKIN